MVRLPRIPTNPIPVTLASGRNGVFFFNSDNFGERTEHNKINQHHVKNALTPAAFENQHRPQQKDAGQKNL